MSSKLHGCARSTCIVSHRQSPAVAEANVMFNYGSKVKKGNRISEKILTNMFRLTSTGTDTMDCHMNTNFDGCDAIQHTVPAL